MHVRTHAQVHTHIHKPLNHSSRQEGYIDLSHGQDCKSLHPSSLALAASLTSVCPQLARPGFLFFIWACLLPSHHPPSLSHPCSIALPLSLSLSVSFSFSSLCPSSSSSSSSLSAGNIHHKSWPRRHTFKQTLQRQHTHSHTHALIQPAVYYGRVLALLTVH